MPSRGEECCRQREHVEADRQIPSIAGEVRPAGIEKPEALPRPREPESSRREPLSLADLQRIAFQNHPTLAAAAARMNAARGRMVQAGLYPNPTIGYHATEIGNAGTAGQQGAFFSQQFITGGKRQLDQAIAAKAMDEARYRLRAQEQRVLSDVRVRFYEALAAQRRVELTRELARIGDELVRATEKLIEGRLGTENDLLQAEIKAEEARILLDNARNEHLEAWRRLASVAAAASMPVTPLAGQLDSDLPGFEWASCQAMVLDRHPDLREARTKAARARLAVERARREPIPNVDLWVSVRHHNVTTSDVANVQFGFPIPLFDRNQGNRRAAEAEWVAACNEIQRIELALQDRLAVVYRRYANARQQVERYGRTMVPKAEQSLQLVRVGYEEGEVEYLTLLNAQQTFLQVNLSYLDALRELWAATAVIEGRLLTGSLMVMQ